MNKTTTGNILYFLVFVRPCLLLRDVVKNTPNVQINKPRE